MAIQYKVVQRGKPGVKNGKKQFHFPLLTNRNTITTNEFCKLITKVSPFSIADVMGLIWAMINVLTDQLGKGNIVQIGQLGSFYPTLHYTGTQENNNIKEKDIEVRIRFHPSVPLKRDLSTSVSFREVKEKK
jgi:predicted histone-like DNA-binding protein